MRARAPGCACGAPTPRAASRLRLGLAIVALVSAAHVVPPGIVPALGAPDGPPWPGRGLPADLRTKLDPALLPFALGPADTATVWVVFRDKDPAGPAAEAESLATLWDRLAPRARARRERARALPRVDALDLPVAPAYLAPMRAAGFRPFAISRWFNRAAVRVTPDGLAHLAALPGVSAIARVRRGLALADRGAAAETRVSPARGGRAGSLAGAPLPSAQSGLTLGQLEQIDVTAVHDSGYVGTGVLIAILDDGFNFHDKHDALRDQVIAPGFSRDFVEGDTVVTDTTRIGLFDHGTQTFGCLAGDLPGVYLGSAYGATFALGRTENDAVEQPVEMLYWAQGAEWADSLGADVISSSVGYGRGFDAPFPDLPPAAFDGHTSDISRAAEIAASKGILVVNAAGNDGASGLPVQIVVPADVNGDSLIAVGAVDTFGSVASFSSHGPTFDGRLKPDLMARGQAAWIVSASGAPDAYLLGDGTSFSTPLVAGLAACLLQARPSWTPAEVIRALRETASNVCAPDNVQGWGLPDGRAALGWTPGPPAPDLPPRGYLELALDNANPFVPRRTALQVRFGLGPRLAAEPRTRLRVFDIRGRLVRNLYLGPLCCGRWQRVEWAGDDNGGRAAPSGVYFVHFDAEGRMRNQRVVLLR